MISPDAIKRMSMLQLLGMMMMMMLGLQQLKLTRRRKVEAVVIKPCQPVEIPTQIGEGHVVEEASVVAVEQTSSRTAVAERGRVGVEVVGVGEELLEHVLGGVVEEALGGGVHEGGHVLYLLTGGVAPRPAPNPRPLAGLHRVSVESQTAAAGTGSRERLSPLPVTRTSPQSSDSLTLLFTADLPSLGAHPHIAMDAEKQTPVAQSETSV